jgi:hypothetical protein
MCACSTVARAPLASQQQDDAALGELLAVVAEPQADRRQRQLDGGGKQDRWPDRERVGPMARTLSAAPTAAGHLPACANPRQVEREAGKSYEQQAHRLEHCTSGCARRVQQERNGE